MRADGLVVSMAVLTVGKLEQMKGKQKVVLLVEKRVVQTERKRVA